MKDEGSFGRYSTRPLNLERICDRMVMCCSRAVSSALEALLGRSVHARVSNINQK